MEAWKQDNRREVVMVDLDALVPKDHLLRKIERVMDYDWLYERLSPYYCHDNGRSGTDPVVLVKMVLVQHLYGIPSLRQTYADGFDFEFLLYQNEQATTIAEICANQWAELGVNVTITVLDMATWFSLYVAEDYDAVIAGMSNTTGDPDESLYIQFYSTQQKMFSTPELDALLDKERACTDTAEREAALNELLEYLASQVPWIPLCTTYSYYAASASLENLPNATFRALADYGQVYWVD